MLRIVDLTKALDANEFTFSVWDTIGERYIQDPHGDQKWTLTEFKSGDLLPSNHPNYHRISQLLEPFLRSYESQVRYAVTKDVKGELGVFGPFETLKECLHRYPTGFSLHFAVKYEINHKGERKVTPSHIWNGRWNSIFETQKKECSRCNKQFEVPISIEFHSDVPQQCGPGCNDCPHYSTCIGTLHTIEMAQGEV